MAEPTSDAELGDPAYGSDARTVTYEAAEDITAGDAVDINSGEVRPANSGDTGVDLVGVAAEDGADGDNISVHIGGSIVVNAAGGVTAGDEVAASTTDGQVDTGTGPGWIALTDSGSVAGLSAGYGLGTNAAVVDLG
jgi:hypothetical protein